MQRAAWLMAVAVLGLAMGTAAAAAGPAEIPVLIRGHRFSPDEVRVKAGTPVVLVLTNQDATAEEFESRDLRLEKVVPAGKTLRLRLPALRPGVYGFVGEYHEKTATGRIVVE